MLLATRIMNALTMAILAFTVLYLQDTFSEILSVATRVQFGAAGVLMLAFHAAGWWRREYRQEDVVPRRKPEHGSR